MKLRAYLDDHEITIAAFADAIGVSVQAVHRYLTGERVPRPAVMARIETATQGTVQPNDFHFRSDRLVA